MSGRFHQHRRPPSPQQLGGSVTVSPVRNRTGDDEDSYSVSWHSNGGDLVWLSPKIASEEAADTAAMVLGQFCAAVVVKR